MEMTTLKMKSILTTNLVEVLITIDMLLLTMRSSVHLTNNSNCGIHTHNC